MYATHERAGEILYKHISGLTYQITLITYTYTPSPADRNELEVFWGDGTSEIIQRSSKTNLGSDVQQNVYIGTHTYPAMGSYIISMEDPNRNQGIINVPYSVDIPFYIESELIINPFLTFNNSPILENPPIDIGCVSKPFYHNPGAVDLDGDSLAYSLVKCKGYGGQDIPGYTIPLTSNSIGIDAVTGDFYWDSPVLQGEYNIAILIEEYRHGVKVGSVIRDMQIIIMACDNNPPEIVTIDDTCVNAGDTLIFKVLAKDKDYKQVVTMTAASAIFHLPDSLAYFDQPIAGRDSVFTYFSWPTNCYHVQKQAYSIVFKAKDNGAPVSLASMKTSWVTVVAPAPQNLQAFPFERTILLSWDSACSNAAGYRIYRREGKSGFIPQHCETGVPPYTGYKLIGEVKSPNITSFVDDNEGYGLRFGIEYCYVVIAYFDDNAESYASREICAMLKNYLPIITHVSIEETNNQSGKILIRWTLPDDIDTIQYPGPYSLAIKRDIDTFTNVVTIHTFPSLSDTAFIDSLQNTESHQFYYVLGLYNHTNSPPTLIDYSDPASSVFLNIDSTDKALLLSWDEAVPWHNTLYEIYRYNPITLQFDSIGSTNQQLYIDKSLTNGERYCYYVQSVGNYDDTNLVRPLLNKSQIKCGVPVDIVSPCTPLLSGETDCIDIDLEWKMPFDSCFDDITKYYIYYTEKINGDYRIIDSVLDGLKQTYSLKNPISIVGCFTVRAIDSINNYSDYSNKVCFDIDLCNPYYLPNIFSPNSDGINDLFTPFYPYEMVESVDMRIYNRWGALVFKTDNPDILWDGTNQFNTLKCAEGVYYYACDVREYTLFGIRTRFLQGSITLVR
ncbi:MAG: gliding motility-associated C-terminal domain-containing protein [Bacteroidales bacterium]|nr:gliding motility-associated C-terminal domain-containing protein [Bacteroidales bacterium]